MCFRITELLKALWGCQGKKQMRYGISRGTKTLRRQYQKKYLFSSVSLFSIMFYCPLVWFSAFGFSLTTSSCFVSSLVNSFIVFFMPPPRAPIITGTIVTVYPSFPSLVSKTSCRYWCRCRLLLLLLSSLLSLSLLLLLSFL